MMAPFCMRWLSLVQNKTDPKALNIRWWLHSVLLLLLLKKGWQCKAGRERLTPYQSEDPNPTTLIHRMKEEKGKTAGNKN